MLIWRVIASLLCMVLLSLETLAAQPVRLEGQNGRGAIQGQGALRKRGNRCYVITPAHVVDGATEVQVITPYGETSTATIKRVRADDRFSVLELPPTGEISCQHWPPVRSEETRARIENDTRPLHLRWITETENVDLMDVGWLPSGPVRDSVLIIAQNSNDSFVGGMSGAQLLRGERVVGLLESVNPTGGVGTVSLLDAVIDELEDFFPPDANLQALLEITAVARLDAPFFGIEGRRVWSARKGIKPFVALQFLGASDTRLRGRRLSGESVNDTASARLLSVTGGAQTVFPTPREDRLAITLYAGATVQHESTEAHQLRYVDSWNYGAALGADILIPFSKYYTFVFGIDTQIVRLDPYREVEVQIVDRSRTTTLLRIGLSYLY